MQKTFHGLAQPLAGETLVETDELGRPKPDPKCYLNYGAWWYKGKPWDYGDSTGCPPNCPECKRLEENKRESS